MNNIENISGYIGIKDLYTEQVKIAHSAKFLRKLIFYMLNEYRIIYNSIKLLIITLQ